MLNKKRSTLETKIEVSLAENKSVAESKLETGIGFFDHMLTLFSFHSDLYLEVKAKGDLEVDYHHTVEDVGIVLGQLIRELYLNKPSYQRYGFFYLPMDESLARVVLDLSGRPHLSFEAQFSKEKIGLFDVELIEEFFNAVAMNSRMTLHIDLLKSGNAHHEAEAIFKAFARSLKIALTDVEGGIPSSKGVIE
ncbi:MAG: imidazoleglycerol-phosphate dehydratase HisB [Clostridiaceae bacterium]|jgi:imidazoleglycerol-phosphate dehydratase|nr:imidazoleglycerol-phosphate dehydratase HisB [Bacillota bacterium]NLN51876.1 imidazoleglycerol-phosphate dehydratase HisB [Clostridiaceae bacterium]